MFPVEMDCVDNGVLAGNTLTQELIMLTVYF